LKKNKLKTSFSDANYSLGFLTWKTSNKLQRLHRTALKDLYLTPTEFSVLASVVYVSSIQEKLTQSFLSKYTEVDKMLISDIIKSLVKKKLVNKKKNPEDSRSFIIHHTVLGLEVANKAIKIVEDIDLKFFRFINNRTLFVEELNRILSEDEARKTEHKD
jgi:DNA-binding MarR family transcriptional regulator